MFLSLLHPTRERAAQCLHNSRLWSEACKDSGVEIEHLLGLDIQDKESYQEVLKFQKEENWFNGKSRTLELQGIRLEYQDGVPYVLPAKEDIPKYLTAPNKVNALAKEATGKWLFFIADDFVPTEDVMIKLKEFLETHNPETEKFVASAEHDIRKLVCHPIMSQAFYKEQGFFFCPEYLHICVDSDLYAVAKLEEAFNRLPDEVSTKFKHQNPFIDGSKWDNVYNVGNHKIIYNQGLEVSEERKIYFSQKYGENYMEKVKA